MSKTSNFVGAVGLLALLASGLVGVQSAAAATPCVTIHRIYYNSPGTDTRSNASLNREWIQLHNRCSAARSLTSSKIKDAARHSYTFSSYVLGAGKYVTVHTGRGTNTSTNRYWGQSGYIWNNDRDTAYLYNRSGTRIDSCSYNNRKASSVAC